MTNKRGIFIVVEGLNGVGKGTLVDSLYTWLTDHGLEVVKTREIGGTDFAEQVRGIVWNHTGISEDVKTMLISAARLDHMQRVIKPALDAGKVVLCDRSFLSTIVFQDEYQHKNRLIEMSMIGIEPDLMLILDAPVELLRERIDGRQRKNGEKISSDHWPLEKFKLCRERMLNFHYSHSDRYSRVICAIPSPDVVFQRATSEIQKLQWNLHSENGSH